MNSYLKNSELAKNEKKIFVFDLHDVLFKRNYWETFKLCYAIKNKYGLLRVLCNPFCVYDAFKLLGITRVSEAYLVKLAKKHTPLTPYVETIIDITNAIKPIPRMFEFINQLKDNGHRLYIFSNIGKKTFEKLNNSYNYLFVRFDGIHYVEEHNDWLAKPHHNAYKLFLKKFNINPELMIFVDDKNKNIKAAHALGITAFIYRSSCELLRALKEYKLIT